MKILMITSGNSDTLLQAQKQLKKLSAADQCELITLEADETIAGCTGCGKCWKKRRCVFDDAVNRAADELNQSQCVIICSDVLFGQPPKPLMDFLARLSHCASDEMADHIAAFVPAGRKHSCEEASGRVMEYLSDAGMIILGGKDSHFLGGESSADQKVIINLYTRMKWLCGCMAEGEKSGLERPEGTYERKLDYVR